MEEPDVIQLQFLGQPMGTLAHRARDGTHALELERSFVAQRHQLSPVHLSLESFVQGPRFFRTGDSPFAGGLPGLIADSLPDAWGERMLKSEAPGVRTIVGKLAAIGERGPGAITFVPPIAKGADTESVTVNLARLSDEAAKIAQTPTILTPSKVDHALAHGGSSLGGARPKVSAHLPDSGDFLDLREIRIGGPVPAGHHPGIVKFSPADGEATGQLEFLYWKLAKKAGIDVPRACLINDGARSHFAVTRFDRIQKPDGTWTRRHVHTLSGLLHQRASDGNLDYRDFIRASRTLCDASAARECFRRAVFNLVAGNRDDHGRNHAFRYDEKTRAWSLTPAYDLTPSVANNLIGLSWMGSTAIPQRFSQVVQLAEAGGIERKEAKAIYASVETAVLGGWREAAKYAGVPSAIATAWEKEIFSHTRDLREDVAADARPKIRPVSDESPDPRQRITRSPGSQGPRMSL